MSSPSPLPTPAQNVVLDTSKLPASSSASVWDRLSKWVSENKALVYTIAGVSVVVTSAGVVYYLSGSAAPPPTEKKKSKNQRRKEKKKAEDEKKAKAASEQDGTGYPLERAILDELTVLQSLPPKRPRRPRRSCRKSMRRLSANCQKRWVFDPTDCVGPSLTMREDQENLCGQTEGGR